MCILTESLWSTLRRGFALTVQCGYMMMGSGNLPFCCFPVAQDCEVGRGEPFLAGRRLTPVTCALRGCPRWRAGGTSGGGCGPSRGGWRRVRWAYLGTALEESGGERFGQTELPHDGWRWRFEGAHHSVWRGRGASYPGGASCCA